jgi:hypothetical protein
LAPEPPPALEPARPRSIPTRAERAPPPVKPRARRWRIYSAARLGLVADLLPKAAPSAWLAFGVAAPAVRLEAFARATGSGAQAVSRSGSIEARLLSGGATACYRASLGAVELAPCAGLELGQFRASGRAIENAHGESALWSAALLQGRLSWRPATRLALTGGAELGAPFRHIEIALSPSERPFSAPPLELGCFWGLDLGFW